jgi:hypothetical protein
MSIAIEDKIERAHYIVGEREVEMLAAAHQALTEGASRISGSYLRILLAAAQEKFGKVAKGPLTEADLEVHAAFLVETHSSFYKAVIRGVTTPDIADVEGLKLEELRARAVERARRGTFARTAASTITSFIMAGGDIRTIDVSTVTKTGLRLWTFENAGGAVASTYAKKVGAAVTRIRKIALAVMKEDPEEATRLVSECMEELQRVLDELSDQVAGKDHDSVLAAHGAAARRPPILKESRVLPQRRESDRLSA